MRNTVLAPLLALAAFVPLAQAQSGIIVVYHETETIPFGDSRQFTTYVTVSPSTVFWSVNDIPGGNTTVGTVSNNGLYTAPASVPMNNVVILKATSTKYANKFGAATITISQPTPWVWSVSPSSMPAGPVSLRLNGAGFVPNSVVYLGATPLTTTYVSSTDLRATGTASQAGTVAVTVRNPGPGGVTSEAKNVTVTAATPVSVSVSPSSASVGITGARQFAATVTGNSNTAVIWSVNGVNGGNMMAGTISSSGLYTAPASVPNPAMVTIRATSVAQSTAFGSATVTVTAEAPTPVTVSISPSSATVQTTKTQQYASTVTGNSNTAVTWSVNGVNGGNATIGTISTGGLYAAPAAAPNPATVSIRATSVAQPSAFGSAGATITATPPPPAPSTINLSDARFLEQAAFGPAAAELTRVGQIGQAAWIDEQFAMPETVIPLPSGQNMGAVLSDYQYRLAMAPDQLRQKVAYALGNLIVISGNKNIYPPEMTPYLQILSANAFGNYRTLLGQITTSPQMGKYLDLANSNKAGMSGGANENYPRELMQLFTIGLWELNSDGSQKLDGAGQPIPTYTQQTVREVARALTGWTYPTAPGQTARANNWEYFVGPMEAREGNHDAGAKAFLNCNLPGGSVAQDTNATLDCIFKHSNLGPFLATRLIRAMVVSNPSPGFIQRVAAKFDDNGQGVRGDMRAVIKAILLDAEARQDIPTASQGRLKEPIYFITAFVRAMGGQIAASNNYAYVYDSLGNRPLTAPSVFSFYSPMYHVPKSPLFGPEFQIYSASESVLRANFVYGILTSQFGSEATVDLTPFNTVAGNIPALLDLVNSRLLYGRMPSQMRQSLSNALAASSDNPTRVRMAIYLTALSGQYTIQY